MVNIIDNIKSVCKRQIVLPLIFTVIFTILIILLSLNVTLHPKHRDTIWNVSKSDGYVTVTSDKLYYSGYNLISAVNGNYGYYYSLENDQCIFVLAPIDSSNPKEVLTDYKFTAKVISSDKAYKKMLSSFSNDLDWDEKSLSKITSGFVLSEAAYHPLLHITSLWISIVFLLISIKKLIPLLLYIHNPLNYPICAHTNKEDHRRLIQQAEIEISQNLILQSGTMYITEHYFIDLDKNKIVVLPLLRIIWCYRMGSVNILHKNHVPEYTMFFTLRNGYTMNCSGKTSEDTANVLKVIQNCAFDIILGYSEAKKRKAKKIVKK